MRFKNLFLGLALPLSFFFISCATQEEEVTSIETNVNASYADVITQIKAIQIPQKDLAVYEEEQNFVQNRGVRWRRFWRWLGIVMSDAVGGLKFQVNKGSLNTSVDLANAIATSISTYKIFKSSEISTPQQFAKITSTGLPTPILNDSTYWKSPTGFDVYPGSSSDAEAHSSGYYHNRIITDLYNKYGNDILNLSVNVLDSLITQKVAVYNVEHDMNYTVEGCDTASVNFVCSTCLNSESLEECIQTFTEQCPDMTSELQVIKAIFERLEEIDIDTEDGDFASEATYIIGNANIPDDVKVRLETILSIANASIRLWNFEN